MLTIASFIFVLGFLVLVHELGHFMVAKKLGVKVEQFSIGFGPKLIGFVKGETEYKLSAFPLGGYVKMAGEEPGEEHTGDPREFSSQSVGNRMAIIIAGPLMNLILTFFLLPIVFMLGVNMPAYLGDEARVGWVLKDSPASEVGLQPGDLIEAINGEAITTWEEALTIFTSNPDHRLALDVDREGRAKTLFLTPKLTNGGGGFSGILHPMPPVVGGVNAALPAGKSGLKTGDLVRSVDGEEVNHWVEMSQKIKASGGKEVLLGIMRGKESLEIKLKPVMDDASERYVIGINFSQESRFIQYGFAESVREGVKRAAELTRLTFDVIKKLFSFNLSIKSLGGPIMIAQATGAAAESGISALISLMAFISLQLGILNLLPIPVLDGGHVFFLLAELGLRRPISIKTREIAQQVGFAILISLMLIVSYNDIMRAIAF